MRSKEEIVADKVNAFPGDTIESDNDLIIAHLIEIGNLEKLVVELLLDIREELG